MLVSKRCFARDLSFAIVGVCLAGGIALAGDEPIRSFGAIQKIFTQSCALTTCHSSVARQGGLILEHEDLSYTELVDAEPTHPDAKRQHLLRVQSGSPGNSFLIRKLRGQGPGDRMPQSGEPLSEEQIKMIEDWITRGAHTRAEECLPTTTMEGASGQTAAVRREVPGSAQPHHGLHIDPALCSDQPVEGEFTWEPEPPLEEPAAGTGLQLYVPRRDVAAGTEWETCYAFRLKDLTPLEQLRSLNIERQEYRMHKGSHHLLLYMYFGAHPEQFKQGFFDCNAGNCIHDGECPEDSGGAQIAIGGTQVAGTRYIVTYPPGVGLPVLGGDPVLIANLHYTNPFQPPQPIYGEAWINVYFHDPATFKVILDGIFAINSGDLIVEPYTTKTIQRLWRPRSFLGGGIADAAVFQLFGHMHKRGREFDIDYVDQFCTGDCNADRVVAVDELVRGVNVALGSARLNRCGAADGDRDGSVGINELVSSVDHSLNGCSPDTRIYRTTEWDNAPVQEYGSPYLKVDRDQALRWTCTHENGRKLPNGEEDPTYPAKKCHEGCQACGWDADSRTCIFTRDGSDRVFQEGEPMPLVFGLLADDDMCNMFGYFIRQEDLPKIQ